MKILFEEVDVFLLVKDKLSEKEISKKILSSDIIYVGGGNTLKMMTIWRKKGVDKILKKAYQKGIVLSGLSAGSICWFKSGSSDSRKYTNKSKKLIKVTGLDLIDAIHCPHYSQDLSRKKELKEIMRRTPRVVAIALDNCCALEVLDKKFRIIKSKKTAKAYKIYWKGGKYYEKELIAKKKYDELSVLTSKN